MNAHHGVPDITEERQRAHARREEAFRDALAKLVLQNCGWSAEPPAVEETALERYSNMAVEARSAIIARALHLQDLSREATIRRSVMPEPRSRTRFTDEQREQIQELLRKLRADNASLTPTEARRRIEEELGFELSSTTFYTAFWQKSQAPSSAAGNGTQAPTPVAKEREPEATTPAASIEETNGNHAPSHTSQASPAEHVTMLREANGQYRVQVDIRLSRSDALRLLQAVVTALPDDQD